MPKRHELGDLLLASITFTDGSGVKRRPVLVIRDGGDADLLVAPVTSQAGRTDFDVRLEDWAEEGLKLPSVARVEKLATIAKVLVIRKLGTISSRDRKAVAVALRSLFDGIATE